MLRTGVLADDRVILADDDLRATRHYREGMRPLRTISAGVALLLLAGCTASPTFSRVDARGETVQIDWVTYPANSGVTAAEVLSAPLEREVEPQSSALLDAIESSLETEFDLTFETEGDDVWSRGQGNGYGGESLLVTYNSAGRQSNDIPTSSDDWRRIVEIVSAETERAGLGDVELLHESAEYRSDSQWRKADAETYGTRDPDRFWQWSGDAYGSSQWVGLSLRDATRDGSGEAAEEAEQYGWPPQSISVTYGATAIDADRRAEFDERVEPFLGRTPPPATTSD